MNITAHFTLDEVLRRSGANAVPPALMPNVLDHAGKLERLRQHFGGRAVTVYSWYRTPARNEEVDGAEDSRHMQGRATDIGVAGLAPRQVVRDLAKNGGAIARGLGLDVVIEYPGHVHVHTSSTGARGLILLHTATGDVPWTDDLGRATVAKGEEKPRKWTAAWWIAVALGVAEVIRHFVKG